MVDDIGMVPFALLFLVAIALLVLLLVGGLIALIVHPRTRAVGATIAGIFGAMVMAGLFFVSLARTSVTPATPTEANVEMHIVADEYGRVIEQHTAPVEPHNPTHHRSYAHMAQPDVANWAKILVVALLIAMVGLLTSGERARGFAVKALGICALIIGGMAVLYFFRSVPGDPYVVTEWTGGALVAEAPPVATPLPPVAPAAPTQVQPMPTVPPAATGAEAPVGNETGEVGEHTTLPAEAPDAGEKPADLTPPAPAVSADTSATAITASDSEAAHEHDAAPAAATDASTRDAKSSAPQPARPDWVDEVPRVASNGDYLTHAKSGYFTTVEESQRGLEADIVRVVQAYLSTYLRDDNLAQRISIQPAWIECMKRGPIYQEHRDVTVVSTSHAMIQLHQQLVIDDAARAEFKASGESLLRASRLWYLGCGALLVLALVGTLFSYLKLDLMTGGTYRGRLQLAATAAILVAAVAALIVS
jgi:hypothetical protein